MFLILCYQLSISEIETPAQLAQIASYSLQLKLLQFQN
jgi:hypothetical protein